MTKLFFGVFLNTYKVCFLGWDLDIGFIPAISITCFLFLCLDVLTCQNYLLYLRLLNSLGQMDAKCYRIGKVCLSLGAICSF